MFFSQDDEGGRATEGVAAVGLQTWDATQTALPVLTPGHRRTTLKHSPGLKKTVLNKPAWCLLVPEDPAGRVLEQRRREDVCERRHRRCAVRTPVEKTNTATLMEINKERGG